MNYATDGSSDIGQDRNVNLDGFLSILAQYRWSIALATLAGLAAALLYLNTVNPVFTASGAVFVDPRSRKIVTDEIIQGGFGTDASLVESQVAIIVSDGVLRRVVAAERLDQDPEFTPERQTGVMATIKDLIRGPRPASEPETVALESLARIVKVKRPARSYVIEVEATTGSPAKSARIVNALLDAYMSDQTAAKSDEARRANALIDSRLGDLREKVRQAEAKIDAFKSSRRLITSEGVAVSEQQLGRLNTELATARSVGAESKARLEQAIAASKAGDPDTLPEAIRSGLVQRLREQLAQVARREAALSSQLQARHPVLIEVRSQLGEIRRQISAELKRIAASARSENAVAAAREREIAEQVEKAQREVVRTTTAQIELRELEQELTTSRELLGSFVARAKETQEQINLSAPEGRVISPANVPTRPSFPPPMLILGLGLLTGLGAGVARALVGDSLDTSIRSRPAEFALGGLAESIKLPAPGRHGTLGRLRDGLARLSFGGSKGFDFSDVLHAISPDRDPSHQAYRQAVLRSLATLSGRARAGEPYIVAVTAPARGVGASSSALALAYSAAVSGERVLLIDAASIDASLSAVFAPEIDPGTPVVLDSKADLSRITTSDVKSGLAFLPIAMVDLRLLKLAQRRRLASGIAALAKTYDLVFVDTGPLLEDEAASSLLGIADEFLVVARSGATSRDALVEACRLLEPYADRPASLVVTSSG